MNFEIPKNVARGTTKGPPSIIDLLQQMNEQLASVNTAVKQSPLETAKAVKEALKPAKPSMPNRKLFETAVGTNIVDREVGFLGRTLVVNNGTNQWWYLKILGAWVQPYQTGLILPVPDGFQTLSLLQQAPTGVSQSGQISGQTITLTVDSREYLATPGVVPSGSGGGGGGGTLTDRSGTITTGGTAQQLAPVNVTRRYLFVENVGTAILWINFTTTAVQSQPSIEIPAGYSFVMEDGFVSTELMSIIGPTTGQAFTAKEA